MQRPLVHLSFIGGALVAALACGAESSDGDPQGPALEEIPAKYADAVCSVLEQCTPLLDFYLGGQSCTDRFGASLEDSFVYMDEAIAAGRVVYNPGRVEQCLADLRAGSCGGNEDPESCDEVLEGQVPLGEACAQDVDCEGRAFCKKESSCPGTCTAAGQAGSDCESDDQCGAGLECHPATALCTSTPGAGDPCGGGTQPDCPLDLVCIGEDSDAGQAGECRSADEVFTAGNGETCDFSGSGVLCQPELVCAFADLGGSTGLLMECAERVAAGAACKLAVPGQCPSDQYCDISFRPGQTSAPVPADFEGTCVDLPRDGQPCADALGGTSCAGGHLCAGGTCRAINRIGGPCQGDEGCYSGNCSGGACVAPESCEIG